MSGDFSSLDSFFQQYEGERNRRILTAQAELEKDRTEGMEALNLGSVPGVERFVSGARSLGLGTEADTLVENAADYLKGSFLDGSRYLMNNLNVPDGLKFRLNTQDEPEGTEMQDFASNPPRVGMTSDIDAVFTNPVFEADSVIPTGEASMSLPNTVMEGVNGLADSVKGAVSTQLPGEAQAFTKNALQVASDAKQSLIKNILKGGAKAALGDAGEDILDSAPEDIAEDPLGGIADLVGGGILALVTGGVAGDLMGKHVDLGNYPSIPMPTFTPQGQL